MIEKLIHDMIKILKNIKIMKKNNLAKYDVFLLLKD